jgi:bifunctional DNA-binding transcriptional regulator/antitoxin component of YhaV-PrlF toxin-antitoxin module
VIARAALLSNAWMGRHPAIDKDYVLAKVRIVSKVTSKLQVTLPKALARQYRIEPGDEILWVAAGDAIRVVPATSARPSSDTPQLRLRLFDSATKRQRERDTKNKTRSREPQHRGWKREELYQRGRSR